MPTTIERSGAVGASTLAREPFPAPNPQPMFRVSALSLQGVAGDRILSMPNLGTSSLAQVTNGSASSPTLRLLDGVPVVECVQNPSAAAGEGQDGFYAANIGAPVRTYVAVVRFVTLPVNTSTSSSQHGHIVRGSTGGGQSLSVTRSIATDPGALQIYGEGAVGQNAAVRVIPGGRLQFVAATMNGVNSVVQVDGERRTVGTTGSSAAEVVIGFNKEGNYTFQFFEIEAFSTVLTPGQLDERRAHYRALAQF